MLGLFLALSACLVVGAANGARAAEISNLVGLAQSGYKAGHFEAALAKLAQREKASGPSGELLDLRGSIALEQGNFDLARKSFTEAHKIEPALFAPRLHLGDLFLRQKKYDEARDVYQRLLRETNILVSNERLRYGLLIIALARHDETAAGRALENIKFPTQSAAYYYAQAAWEFAHGNERAARKWMVTAREIFEPQSLSWFAWPLYDLGWLKEKPPPPTL